MNEPFKLPKWHMHILSRNWTRGPKMKILENLNSVTTQTNEIKSLKIKLPGECSLWQYSEPFKLPNWHGAQEWESWILPLHKQMLHSVTESQNMFKTKFPGDALYDNTGSPSSCQNDTCIYCLGIKPEAQKWKSWKILTVSLHKLMK